MSFDLGNQINQKLGVIDRKLEGSHSVFYCFLIYFIREKMRQ